MHPGVWVVVLFLVGLGAINFVTRHRQLSESWLFFATGLSMVALLGRALPPGVRGLAFVLSIVALLRWFALRNFVVSRAGIKYPVIARLRNNPRIKAIVALNDRRMGGLGSLSVMNQIATYLERDPDSDVRMFAAKALPLWPSMHVPDLITRAVLRDTNKDVRLCCLTILEAIFDAGLGFFRYQAGEPVRSSEIADKFTDTIRTLTPVSTEYGEDPDVRARTARLVAEMQQVAERLASRKYGE